MSRQRVTLTLGGADQPLTDYLRKFDRSEWAGIVTRLAHAGLLIETGKIFAVAPAEAPERRPIVETPSPNIVTDALRNICPD